MVEVGGMVEFHKIWIEQCEAARHIREAYGLEKALGYLIGETFLDFLEACDQDGDFAGELPAFVEGVRDIFTPEEIRGYLDGVRRVGPLSHTASDEAYEEMRAAGAIREDPVEWAEQILLAERARALLVG
jgi:hypothetical protein